MGVRTAKAYRPSPLSTCMSASDIVEEPENSPPLPPTTSTQTVPSVDADVCRAHPSPAAAEDQATLKVPRTPSNGAALETIPAPTKKVSTRIPKYWDGSLPLKGETQAEIDAAAHRARFREIDNKDYMLHVRFRSKCLYSEDIHTMGAGTAPKVNDIHTGDLSKGPECTVEKCNIHDHGASPKLVLAMAATEILKEELAGVDEELEKEGSSKREMKLLLRQEALIEKVSKRVKETVAAFEPFAKGKGVRKWNEEEDRWEESTLTMDGLVNGGSAKGKKSDEADSDDFFDGFYG